MKKQTVFALGFVAWGLAPALAAEAGPEAW